MIIDFHVHIFSPEAIEAGERHFDDPAFALLYASPKSRMVEARGLLSMMDAAGIDRAVSMAFPWRNHEYLARENRYLSEAALISAGRIIPFMALPYPCGEDMDGHVRELKALGAAGIGEVAFYAEGFGAEQEEYCARLFDAAAKADLPVCLHVNEPVGHRYDGKYDPCLGRLQPLLGEHRDTKVVLSHWGGGLLFYELMPEVRGSLEHVYYDTAASPYIYNDEIYRRAGDIVGSGKVLFGSDYPLLKPERYIEAIRSAFPGAGADGVLGENARALLGL